MNMLAPCLPNWACLSGNKRNQAMAMTDPIADLLTRIRNAAKERHEKLEVPASRLKANVVRVLKEEGYIKNFRLQREEGRPVIKVYLKYTENGQSVIQGIRRVSKPGLRH